MDTDPLPVCWEPAMEVINHENRCKCGNYKSRRAVHCKECSISKQQKRMPVLSDEDYCPMCGGRKDRRAKVCRKCVPREQQVASGRKGGMKTAEQRRKTDEQRGVVCPRCLGRKSPRSSICGECYRLHTKRISGQQIERKIRYEAAQ